MRKTKIVATVGPASSSEEKLRELIKSGVDVLRLNFSHGTMEEHGQILKKIRNISDEVGVMMDTQGPEIRLGEIEEGTILRTGDTVKITTDDIIGDEKRIPVDYHGILDRVHAGDTVLLADGELELKVVSIDDGIECEVIYGGKITSKKSLNIPGKDMGLTTPTEKDIEDIRYSVDQGFDFVSASFVKSGQDIRNIRKVLEDNGSDMHIIAKIEHIKAVENLDEILSEADGVMIARGDLGVEVPASDVPIIQKDIIQRCNLKEMPVIVATQMLMSMTESPRATRAEVSDVANAVIDGSDAVMLSEETAVGKYPVKSVEFMSEVVQKVEKLLEGKEHHTAGAKSKDIADIISKNVWQASRDLEARYIVAHTSSGYTAHKISKFRPAIDVIAFTDSVKVQRRLNLVWGVRPLLIDFPEHVDEMIHNSAEFLFDKDMVDIDDTLILTAGVPQPVTGITNMMEIRTVRSLLEE